MYYNAHIQILTPAIFRGLFYQWGLFLSGMSSWGTIWLCYSEPVMSYYTLFSILLFKLLQYFNLIIIIRFFLTLFLSHLLLKLIQMGEIFLEDQKDSERSEGEFNG